MSGIAGIVSLGGAPLAPETLTKMVAAMDYWGPDGSYQHQNDGAGFAYFRAVTTPEAIYEQQPCVLPSGEWFVAAARLDNRSELLDALKIEAGLEPTISDGTLLAQAYLVWGEAVVDHLFGDWSFAVWNPSTRRLFLARDQLGITSLYYHANAHYLAFASSSKALLALDPAIHAIDDLYVVQMILSWPAFHGARSVYTQIQRLPPAHTLVVTLAGSQLRLYWRMEEVKILPLRSLDEAIEGFHIHLERGLQSRLRSAGPVATTLSGGLDSGTLSALAASMLAAQNRSLTAYTSVPLHSAIAENEHRFGNEWELAAATAATAGIIDHRPLDAREVTPLMGVEAMLWSHESLARGAGNAYWIVDLLQRVKRDGHSVLLTGQGGNATISWTGTTSYLAVTSFYQRLRKLFLRHLPLAWSTRLAIWKMNHQDEWLNNSFANANLVRRTHAVEHSVADPLNLLDATWEINGLQQRLLLLKPGRSNGGANWHESGAAFGVDVRDPTEDIRLLTYCLSIPDHLYIDPKSGMKRMLIRQAMAGRLPDDVRLGRRRGLQAADLVARVRADHEAMSDALEHFSQSPAAGYLNLDTMRQAWARIQQGDTDVHLQHKAALLLRAVMAGFFVERPRYPRQRPIASTF